MGVVIGKKALSSREIAKQIARSASDKKAEDIVVLDMRKITDYCDYTVLCSANSDRQAQGIADGIIEDLQKKSVPVMRPQGLKEGGWVVFDLGDVIVHIFEKDTRGFYQLERLWLDAIKVKWS